ncbi:Ger(x)C family spore germination protein [Anaerotignum sp. MB30-C6]|uniref:Ger(x)C family spore germination protein n=1 Tax=Anaerotignum sp. MB30-C6 TaxID=3070814 RepID=UPI0027DB05A7|nr:Ger(x)C family spore germination protein [Anaerotignum sp. MB30-C6]WMI81247.1 Ger(x)C family spore germination protein [Anaerotignum sp. MB30-C6]
MSNWKWIVVTILPLFIATGCWDKRDPEDREYMITMGVDKKDDGYTVAFAPAKTEEKEPKKMVCQGRSLADAIAYNDSRNSRKTELGQLKMIVFGKSILEDRKLLLSLLEELERSQEISKKVTVLATASSAEACIDAMMEEDDGTGLFLWEFYKNTAKEVGVTKGLDMDTFFTELTEQRGSAILPRIEPADGGLYLGGGVGLVDLRFSTFLNDKEEQGYLFLLGEAEGAVLEAEDDGKRIPLRVVNSKVDYDFEKQQDGTTLCRIELSINGDLLGSVKKEAFSKEGTKKLENLFSEIIKTEIENTMKIAQEQDTAELLGLAVRLRRAYPEYSGDFWKDVTIVVEPEIKIRDTGRIR